MLNIPDATGVAAMAAMGGGFWWLLKRMTDATIANADKAITAMDAQITTLVSLKDELGNLHLEHEAHDMASATAHKAVANTLSEISVSMKAVCTTLVNGKKSG